MNTLLASVVSRQIGDAGHRTSEVQGKNERTPGHRCSQLTPETVLVHWVGPIRLTEDELGNRRRSLENLGYYEVQVAVVGGRDVLTVTRGPR